MKEVLVTRTVTSTKITALGVNKTTTEPSNLTIEVPGKVTDKEKAMKIFNAKNQDDEFAPAMVVDLTHSEKIIGVPLSKFMEIGVEVTRPASQTKKDN